MSIKRQTVWSLLPLLVTGGISFVSMPLFLRFLGDDMYALWMYIGTLTGQFGFADMGLGVVVGRYIAVALGKSDQAAVRGYWGTGNLIVIPFLILASLMFIGIGVWLGPKWFNVSPANFNLLRLCFVASGFGLFLNYYGTYWLILSQAHLDFKFISVLRTSMNLLQILPTIALAFFTRNPLVLIIWGLFVSLLQLGIFIRHSRRNYDLGFHFPDASLGHAREMAVYAGKNFFGLLAGSFFGSIDRLILGKSGFAPAADYAHYVVASNLSSRLQSLSVAVMGPVLFNTARAVGGAGKTSAAKIYNETFAFVFDWYLLAALWVGLWHPVLVRFWLAHTMGVELGEKTALQVAPLLVPLVVACCFTALANISGVQLASLNRLGTNIGFGVAAGLLAIAGVWIGWKTGGIFGAAYGFLFSRVALVAQDLFTIRLIKAGGWLDRRTWEKVGAQSLVGAAFALSYFAFRNDFDSYWLLIPAALHGGLVALWISRHSLRKFIMT
jgi:O-antigen/teichoic acid export membrane protein